MATTKICFHHLRGTCDYGDNCWKIHTTPNTLSPAQAGAFERFCQANGALVAPKPKVPIHAAPSKPKAIAKPKVAPKIAAPAEKPAQQPGEVEEDIPSCFEFPLGNCKRSNCKWEHRDLVDFTDEELAKFQRTLKKSWPKVCFAALQGDCDNSCGRVHKLEANLSFPERFKWDRFQANLTEEAASEPAQQ
jgi:hypothetical protein